MYMYVAQIPLMGSFDGKSWAKFLKKTCGTRLPNSVGSVKGPLFAVVPVNTLRGLCDFLNNCLGICPKLCMNDMTALRLMGSSIVSMSWGL